MLGSGDPKGQQGVFGNDLATMLDPNHRLYRLATIIPVSYTHLDVYKRQLPECAVSMGWSR